MWPARPPRSLATSPLREQDMQAAISLAVVVGFFASLAVLSLRYGDRGFGHAPGKEETLAAFGVTWNHLASQTSASEPRLDARVARRLSAARRSALGTLVSRPASSR